MIGIARNGPRAVRGAEWNKRQAAFDQRYCVVLEDFVHPSLLAQISPRFETEPFEEYVHADDDVVIATELTLPDDNPLARVFAFLLNQKALLAAVREFAHCDADIQSFRGRCLKMLPGVHFDSWHNDVNYERHLALSINLQPEPVSGGEFQIRHAWSGTLYTFPMPRFGDALLFQISPLLTHRVLPIKGVVPRICYAGWFQTTPSLFIRPRKQRAAGP